MKKIMKAQKGKVIDLKKAIDYSDAAVVSKTIVVKKTGTITLFAFDKGQALSEHTAPFDAVVQVLDGEAAILIGGKEVFVCAGQMVIMPANVPHALRAKKRFKMLLTMIRE